MSRARVHSPVEPEPSNDKTPPANREQQMKRDNASHCCFEMRPFVRKDSLVTDVGVSLCDTVLRVNSCTVFLYLCRFVSFVSINTGVVFILINIFVPSVLYPTSFLCPPN